LAALRACDHEPVAVGAAPLSVSSPIDGEELLELEGASAADASAAAGRAAMAFGVWRAVAPEERAAVAAALARELDRHGPALAELIAIETGKPMVAAAAEVEAAVGAIERAAEAAVNVAPLPARDTGPVGRFEARRPLGPVAVLSSYELPLLDWAIAAPLALACGCPVVWLPGAPLVATAVNTLVDAALRGARIDLPGLHTLICGEADAAEALAGSAAIGLVVEPHPPRANVAIVGPAAELDSTTATLTAATVAGAGRSPAALHLAFVHASIAPTLEERLMIAFAAATVGDPLASPTALGPLRDLDAYRDHLDAIQTAEAEGGKLLVGGGSRDLEAFPSAYYVEPALIRAAALLAAVSTPVLFLATYTELDEALVRRDSVARRWSAFLGGTEKEGVRFLAARGSDRGFVAVGVHPGEAEVAVAAAPGWRSFTRAVAGRVS
jgi:aldehyde dehydrogenase (NAD+)